MQNTLVTVIVPVYNVEKYLKNCIESILNQTYKNVEIILVNDGSTDKSAQICEEYSKKSSEITFINKKNEGLSSARQKGIDESTGKYFCTIDSDDYIEKTYLEKMLCKIEEEQADICVCGTREYSKRYSKNKLFNKNIVSPFPITKEDLGKEFNKLAATYYMSDSWNKIYRKKFVLESKVKFELSKEYNGTDLLFNHLLLLHLPKISVVNEPLYNYQILENSRVRRKDKPMQKGFNIIYKRILTEIEKLKFNNLLDDELNYIYVIFQRNSAQDIFNTAIDRKELKRKLKDFFRNHRDFSKTDGRLKLNTNSMNTKSMKIFNLILKINNVKLLTFYLKIRKKAIANKL